MIFFKVINRLRLSWFSVKWNFRFAALAGKKGR
jgi:hypothetical protein